MGIDLDTVLPFTRALPSPDEMSNRTRVDVTIVYDLLGVLRRGGTFGSAVGPPVVAEGLDYSNNRAT